MKIVANNKIKNNFYRSGHEVIRANSKELAFLFNRNFLANGSFSWTV